MNTDKTKNDLPDFPVFEISDFEVAFGCDEEHYIPRDQSYEISRKLRREADVFSALFYEGGKLSDHGLKFRQGVDKGAALRCIRGLMSSWDAAHEQKEATVALALHHWCESTS